MSTSLAENIWNLCWFWLDKEAYFFSWQLHYRSFSWILERAKQVSAHENHPTRAVEMTLFASKNRNLFGCVSKTSCCEYLVKDTCSEKMTQLSQAPLTALFFVILCVCVLTIMPIYISATGLRPILNLMLRQPKGKQNGCVSLSGHSTCV